MRNSRAVLGMIVVLWLCCLSTACADVLRESRSLFLAGDQEGALALLEGRLREAPDDVDAHLSYAFVRGSLGEREQVRVEYMKRLQGDPENPVFLVTFLSVSPPSLMKASMFEHLLADHPDFVAGWEEWGRFYLLNWKPGAAVAPLEHAIALSPGRTKSLLYLGLAHRTLGNFVKEIKYVGLAFKADSLDPQVRAEWAFTILDRGDPALALRVVGPLLESGIRDDYPFVIAAVANSRLGEQDAFQRWKRKAEEQNPNVLNDLLYRGIQFREVANGREAERMFRLALALDPDFEKAGLHLGIHQMKRGRNVEAQETLERVVRTPAGKQDVMVWRNLGAVSMLMGEYENAVRSFDEAIAIDPSFVGVRVERARALTNLARYNEAAEEWERVIELDPRGWNAREARSAVLYLRNGEAPPTDEAR